MLVCWKIAFRYLTANLLHGCCRFSDPGHVFYGGPVIGESAMSFVEDVGPEVTHGYEV